jgi:uncharacterized protein (DUF934 family)
MLKVISFPKNESPKQITNIWQILRNAEGEESAALPSGKVIVPFSWWLARGRRHEFSQRIINQDIGVWFSADDDVLAHSNIILEDQVLWSVIAVDFPVFRDGRGFSTAALLRQRLGWSGELQAIGDVLIDQLLQLSRVGFDTFVLRHDQNIENGLKQFDLYGVSFQNDWRSNRTLLSQVNL